jgi:aspartate kinase
MKVIKIGGGSLKDKETIEHIFDLIATRGQGNIFVLSALNGVTDALIDGMSAALADENTIAEIISDLRSKHILVARQLISNCDGLEVFSRDLDKSMSELDRLYYGLNFTREITPRMRDMISSYGERFAVELFASALRCRVMANASQWSCLPAPSAAEVSMPHTACLNKSACTRTANSVMPLQIYAKQRTICSGI